MSFIVLVVVQVSMCNGKMLAPAWTITDRSDSWVLHDEWTSSRISCFVPVVYGFVVPTAFGNWRSGKNKQKNKTKQRTEKKRRFQSRQKKEEIIENNIPPPFCFKFYLFSHWYPVHVDETSQQLQVRLCSPRRSRRFLNPQHKGENSCSASLLCSRGITL